MVSRW